MNIPATFTALLITTCFTVRTGFSQSQPEYIVSAGFFIPMENTIYYSLGDAKIPMKIVRYGDRDDIICINLHDNEQTSVEAAKTILQGTGGTLVKIENNRQRVIRFNFRGNRYAFDPNRMFSREGIMQSLKENCGKYNEAVIDMIDKFAQRVLDLIPPEAKCIIALHNNTNDAFSIKSYLEGNDRDVDAKEVSHNLTQDPDDIILTTDDSLFSFMSQQGYNAILQDNENARKDGSLSIWSGENGRRYINIETQHGRLKQYIEMLKGLLDHLSDEER